MCQWTVWQCGYDLDSLAVGNSQSALTNVSPDDFDDLDVSDLSTTQLT